MTYWIKPANPIEEQEGEPLGPFDGPIRLLGEDCRDAHDNVIAQLHDDNFWYITKKYNQQADIDGWSDLLIYVESEEKKS